MARGKGKGQAFEREICKRASLFVSGGTRTDIFWRTAMSGGRATVHNRDGVIRVRQGGDLCAVAPEGFALVDSWYFEIKFYANLEWQNFIFLNRGTVARFWARTVKGARAHNKSPVMVAKQNFAPTILVTPWENWGPFRRIDPVAVIPGVANLLLFDDAIVPPKLIKRVAPKWNQ